MPHGRLMMITLALVCSTPGGIHAQVGGAGEPLSLAEALELARRQNVELAVRESETRMSRAEVRSARAALLPRVEVGADYIRSVDPVNAFGTKLRQGVFGEPDFGLRRLNDPDDIGDWNVRTSATWSLVAPARLAAHAAAGHRAEAAAWSERRQREATDFRTRALYFRARGVGEELRAAEAALQAARSTRDVFGLRFREGVITRADLLGAEAEVEAAVATLAEVGARELATRERLALYLGMETTVPPVPVDPLPPVDPSAVDRPPGGGDRVVVRFSEEGMPDRADLQARRSAVEAAEAEQRRAGRSYLPSLQAFGIVKSHDPDFGAMDAGDWTVGLGLRWSAFEGFARDAKSDRARAVSDAARLEYRQAVREARSEIRQARVRLGAARRAVEALEAARGAAREGRELMRRRFEEGMATPSDLLRAEARVAEIEARAALALADYHVAEAWLAFVRGDGGMETTP